MAGLALTAGMLHAQVPAASSSVASSRPGFSWPRFVAGAVTSVAAHELTHVAAALVLGGSPSLTFDQGRPVIHSGIPIDRRARAFAFSASGMGTQVVINEILLAWPRPEGSGLAGEFERGLLAGGVGTIAFYLTVGRRAAVGDVQQMATYSGLSAWGVTAIFGGVAASEVIRMALRDRYAHFFAAPARDGRLTFGLSADF